MYKPPVQSTHTSPHSTHHARRVEQTVLDHRIRQARRIALVVPRIAPAHRVQRPADIHPCAAAREQQVVVVLVLLRRRPVQRRALDRQDRRPVVRRAEDVAPEAICRVLPAEREALREDIRGQVYCLTWEWLTWFQAGSSSYHLFSPGSE
jgi:hypothetical protein